MTINLNKKAPVKIYQVEMELQKKNSKSPFVAVLLLALELSYDGESITPEILRTILLPSLPLRACNNLLRKLMMEGYLENSDSDGYKLSDKGFTSAQNKAYWIGERGTYNVYVYDCDLVNQPIIYTERKKMSDNVLSSEFRQTPGLLMDYMGQEVVIGNEQIRIETIKNKCLPKKEVESKIVITSEGNDTNIQISIDGKSIHQNAILITVDELFQEIMQESREWDYDAERGAVLIRFDKKDLRTIRELNIHRPVFKEQAFQEVGIANIPHLPQTEFDAQQWYENLLLAKLNRHFETENDFNYFSGEIAAEFKDYNVQQFEMNDLVKTLESDKQHFYQRAYLETSKYLSY